MKTIKTTVYQFDELSDDAKEVAIESQFNINISFEWWEFTFEDAENVGLKLTDFDIDRASYCQGEFISDACFTAKEIIKGHGEMCETLKTSKQFLFDYEEIFNNAARDKDGEFEDDWQIETDLGELETEYLKSILEDYRIILHHEFEYQTSEKAIIETIEANEYDFLENGKMF